MFGDALTRRKPVWLMNTWVAIFYVVQIYDANLQTQLQANTAEEQQISFSDSKGSPDIIM